MEEEVPFSKKDGKQGSLKNTVGDLHNVQNARIGDETHIHYYTSPTALPKDLTTSMPKVNHQELIGREEDLKELHGLLSKGDSVVVVNGLGGVGKTTLAQAYVDRYYNEYKHIAWVTQTSESIVNDVVSTDGLIRMLKVDTAGMQAEQLFGEVVTKLKSIEKQPNLLIIDNAEQSLSAYRHRLPGSPNWRLLVTSREEMEEFQTKRLDFLEEEQAVQLFKKHYTLRKLQDEEIRELVKAVDYHTLLIEILAKTARVQRYSSDELRQAIEKDLKANIRVGRQEGQVERIGSYLGTVFNLSRLSETELWLVKQFVCLPSEFHSYELARELTVTEESSYSEPFAETISGLAQKGWLLYNPETDSYKMHRIITEVIKKQHKINIDEVSALANAVIQRLGIDRSTDNPVDKFPWIPFGKMILDNFQDNAGEKLGALQNNLATVLRDFGNYEEARTLLEKAVQAAERSFGLEHPSTAACYSNLALVLKDLREYKGARALLEKAVQSNEKSSGPESSKTATSYSNLALVLQSLGEFERARALMEKVVQSDEKNFGPEHPNTTISYSNLAMVLKDLGDYKEARVLLEKAVQSEEKSLGLGHPSTAISYSNLAVVLLSLGDLKASLEFSEKALNILRGTLPEGHPYILQAIRIYKYIKSLAQK